MSRRISIKRRVIKKDFRYNKLKTKKNPILILEKSIKNISPRVKLEATYLNKSIFQVPKILNLYYSTRIAIKWLIENSKKRSGKSMSIKLSNEIFDSLKGIGNSIKKRDEMHKRAEANKAFVKFNN